MIPRASMLVAGVALALALAGCATLPPVSAASVNGSQGAAASASAAAPAPAPLITHEQIVETTPIPFDRSAQQSAELPAGTSKVTTQGQNGLRTTTYDVTYTNGVETDRKVTSDSVTTEPIAEVTTTGTYVPPAPPAPVAKAPPPAPVAPAPPASNCDPNYTGACVPIASDVDCAGGSGNGPAYVKGPVRVVGQDIYDLDRDGDGIGCN